MINDQASIDKQRKDDDDNIISSKSENHTTVNYLTTCTFNWTNAIISYRLQAPELNGIRIRSWERYRIVS